MHMCIHANTHSCICSAYVHSCKHAFMQTCLHTCINLQVCMRTCVHLYMQSCLHTCMMREMWCLVWWERERERAWCNEIMISLKPFFRHSHPTLSLSQDHIRLPLSHCRSPPTNLIPSLLLESRFSLFLSHSLSRHVRFYSNLSSHHILISLSHTHANSHSSPPFLPSSPRIEKMRVVAETVSLR